MDGGVHPAEKQYEGVSEILVVRAIPRYTDGNSNYFKHTDLVTSLGIYVRRHPVIYPIPDQWPVASPNTHQDLRHSCRF